EVTALAATGRCETAARLAVAAYKAYVDLPEQVAMPGPGVHVLHRMHALAECGRIEDSARLAASGYEGTQANSPPIWQMWCAYHQGRSALLAGRVQTARRWLAEALARCEEHDIVGPRRLVLSALATAAALGGDAQASRTACQHLDRLPPFPYWAAEQERGRAWCLVAEGDAAGARRVLADAADHAAATGHRSVEGLLLHDIARLGEARSVAARLADVAAGCEGRMVAAYAAHADAAARADGSALVGAVERFEEMGLLLPAAEAATDAARAFRRAGEQRSATALGVRADALAAQCEGATSPALADPVSVVPLTAREREIAVLAARGVASREIAEQLYLSVRTVNNHLQNAYAKLGVSSRKELAAALDDN
ncbi:MAG: helix-turn-helix transcriptional regulator, partial [Acidimicrobiia bacterium]|nr:helix-turn-helix transcriptional regulator [Acidimicrobiia bacterium]